MDNDKQITGFTNGIARATAKLEALAQHLDDHCNLAPDDVTWASVGSIQNVDAKLDSILEFLNITVKDALA